MKNRIAKLFSIALILALMVGLLPAQTQQVQAATPTDLFFSEYVEGSSYNKALEIFNGTGSTIDLAAGAYKIQMFSNGSASAGISINLTGTVTDGDVYVVTQSAASETLKAYADQIHDSMSWYNGDDAIALVKDTTIIDVIGQIGFDPGTEWVNGSISTLNHTLRRLSTFCSGDPEGNDAFDPSLQWEGFAQDTFDGLGSHSVNCTVVDIAPTVTSSNPIDGAADVSLSADLSVTFSEPVTLTDPWFTLTCSTSGVHTAAVSGGPTTFTLNPDIDFVGGETCTFTIIAAKVADKDGDPPYDTMVADYVISFTAVDVCTLPFTPIYDIQGSGSTAAITGAVTTRGVVVGDFETPTGTGQIRGFYLQDTIGDGNSATSDGIFVYNSGRDNVNVGDLVRVTGTASDYNDQTQISVPAGGTTICGTATVNSTPVVFPLTSTGALEPFEGMLVRIEQSMYVTEHYQLGRFGQVTLSNDGRLKQPTNVVAPGAPALALQAENNLRRIILDDANNSQNADPIVFARGGQPLSASNTLRGGDFASGIVGVMTYTWAGDAASGNAWRIRPINAMNGYVNFQVGNERPTDPPDVGGTVKVVGMNLLNYFNTFTGCTNGVGGTPADCRGASDAIEFDRQWTKTVAAIVKMDADVIGFTELENDGYGAESAIAHLVDKLNLATAAGTYSFIDVDTATGQTNALGVDGIKVGMIYKPGTVTPVGQTAVLNTTAFVNGGDAVARNRPTLAQAFAVNVGGALFIVDVNHLKSKGSACTVPDAGDGQGNCNAVRVAAATELVNWLATDPTGTGDTDILLVGDYNAYAMEDPITTIKTAGYTNLIDNFIGEDAYSYVFDGQWGYLDHALASASLASQVTGVGEYHINADEPSVLDYLEDFKSVTQLTSLYAPDEFRISDHDPVIVGLNLIPEAPNVLYPTNNTTKVNPTFKWSTVPGAEGYELAVVNSLNVTVMDQTIPLSACGLSQCVFSPTTAVLSLANGSYTWWVRADMGSDNYSAWGSATFTKVAPPAPKFPAISSTMPNPKFIWTKVANQTRYQLILKTAAGVVKLDKIVAATACSGTTCSFTPSLAVLNLANGAYKWQVRAGDAMEWGVYSLFKNFNKVAPPAPITPSGTITLTNPKFTWKKIPGATKYYLRLETSTGTLKKQVEITAPVCTTTTCSYTFNPTLNLAKGIYKWKVRAFNGYYGPYSGYLTFTKK